MDIKMVSHSARLYGEGYVVRKDSGLVVPFFLEGEADEDALAQAADKASWYLARNTGLVVASAMILGALLGDPVAMPAFVGAVTHSTSARNAACNAVVDLLDAGAGSPNLGTLLFVTNASPEVEVATCVFGNPAFGNASSGTATANAITSDTNATGGTVASFRAQDSAGAMIFRGAVGTSGSDINLSSLSIGNGDTVSISSLTYSAAS